MIPYGRQSIGEDDIAAVVNVLRGDWLTQGPEIESFETAIADYVQTKYAVAFSSCTAALHAAHWAAGLGAGDNVFTSPITFIATANAARYVGATPSLIDIDPDTLNINLARLPDTAGAVVPVHFAGLPVDLRQPSWHEEPRVVIEDAAHALGASTPDGPVGNCSRGDMTCFSFHPVKPITSGEGGMVTTNDADLAEKLRIFRSHGIVRKPEQGEWYYEATELGMHYRMTDVQAALGRSQLKRIDFFIERRNEIAERYRDKLRDIEELVLPPAAPAGFTHGYHLFAVRVERRRELFDFLRQRGIWVQVHYVPVHFHPISRDISVQPGSLREAEYAYERLLSLPIHPSLTVAEQDEVISSIKTFFS